MNFFLHRISALFVAGCFFWSGLLVSIIHAEDIYVAQTARGSDTGASASNAHSLAWLNTAGNWGPGANTVSPGDTVHLSGTFTSTFTIQGSGASGNVITILFEPGAKFEKAVWQGGAIAGMNKSFITIDGGTNGLIQATDNGTALGNQVSDSVGLNFSGISNFIIRNLKIDKMYVRTPGSADGRRYGGPIVILDVGSNVTIENCSLFEGDTCIGISFSPGTASNLIIRNNTIGRCNHGITIGTSKDNSYVDDCVISGNRINDLDVWEGNSGLHLDGVILFNESPGTTGGFRRLRFYGNYIGPNIGKTNTAALFMDHYAAHQMQDSWVYNNLFTAAAGLGWSNGFVNGEGLIVNNTFVAGGVGIGVKVGSNSVVENNLFYNVGLGIYKGLGHGTVVNTVTDNNIFYGLSNNAFYDENPATRGTFSSLTQWKQIGHDPNSVSTQPILDANYVPTSTDTVARGKGINFSQYFKTDKNGNPRPSSGPWTIGAFEKTGTTSTPAPASTPPPASTPAPASTPPRASTPPPASTSTPVAAFGFNEGSGESAFDASGNANTGTITGATRAPGKFGNSLNFDGISDLVRINGSASLNMSSGMTLEAWVKPTANQSGWRNILQRETAAYFLHASHDQGALRPATGGTFDGVNNVVAAPSADVISLNNSWVHLASTYDGTTLRLYVDGDQVAERAVSGSIETNNNPLWIGGNKPYGEFFQGQIDEVRIYNRALSESDIRRDMITPVGSSGGTTPTPSPTPGSSTFSVSFPADSEKSTEKPTGSFAVTDGYISQSSGTGLTEGGRVVYEFTVPDHGEYSVIFEVDAANAGENSLYLNIDAEPQDPVMIWDIPATTGFQSRVASWRGGGTFDNNQFVPKYFLLSPGDHELIIRGREANTKFKKITIVKRP